MSDQPTRPSSGELLAAFNERRTREDGADIAYKMAQKAKNGGTLGKAPLGCSNEPEIIDGRRINNGRHRQTACAVHQDGV